MMNKPISQKEISSFEVQRYLRKEYKVTTVVPLTEKPVMQTYEVNQEGLSEFLEGYNDYAEFIVNVEMLDKTETGNKDNKGCSLCSGQSVGDYLIVNYEGEVQLWAVDKNGNIVSRLTISTCPICGDELEVD